MRLTKMLGLAVLAALAMSVVAASAASGVLTAEFFHEAKAEAEETNARVIAKNEGAHIFTAGLIGTISCGVATFTGTSFVTSPQSTITVVPAYSGCTFLKIPGVKVETHKCAYKFNQPTGTGPFTGTVNIVNCPVGEEIEFETGGCKIAVGQQGPLSSITYTNQTTSPKSVKVSASISKITYTASGTCIVTGTKTDGTYSGAAIADAETLGLALVGVFIK